MKTDSLKQFVTLRQSLISEKAAIERRLKEISAALAGQLAAPAAVAPKAGTAPKPRRRRKRPANKVSLKQLVVEFTKAKPLTKPEILKAVLASGYKFATAKPMGSVNVILYGRNPKFTNKGGKFTPAK
jgi:hypothetical protein